MKEQLFIAAIETDIKYVSSFFKKKFVFVAVLLRDERNETHLRKESTAECNFCSASSQNPVTDYFTVAAQHTVCYSVHLYEKMKYMTLYLMCDDRAVKA